ncbi:extracellular solute-binding protein [Cellulomonas triticagri]|uniref:extracellular solute-binding protein n=1 Tax=Cellulomonas triticagri TaxID=2483352 RepID=UPI0013158281|nr:extracellular solute-binding protein [Cellulomonas triticagri]
MPSAEEVVDVWNEANPDVQVRYSPVANGQEAYPKIRSSVQAGDGGCLAQLTLDQVSSFVADGMLLDVSEYVGDAEDLFLDWTWAQVSPGGATYAIPQDTGPMAMYYRADLFDQFGIDVPTTWDEFATAAETVHAADPSKTLTYLATDDASTIAAYAWQRGAQWFEIDGEAWQVGIDDDASVEAAEYWQGLLDSGAIATTKRWDPGFYAELNQGTYLAMIGGAWNTALIEENVAETSGSWRVAPMPTVDGSDATANSGGSAVAVLKGCENPEAAVEFATWLNSSDESLAVLTAPDGGGLYPAVKDAPEVAAADQELEFFGGQDIAEVFDASAQNVNTDWAWGPTYSTTDTGLTDGLASVATGGSTLPDMLAGLQETTVAAMQDRGIAVAD